MSAEVILFVPKPRRTRPRIGPLIRVPNAIEEVFVKALRHPHEAAIQDTAPAEMPPAS